MARSKSWVFPLTWWCSIVVWTHFPEAAVILSAQLVVGLRSKAKDPADPAVSFIPWFCSMHAESMDRTPTHVAMGFPDAPWCWHVNPNICRFQNHPVLGKDMNIYHTWSTWGWLPRIGAWWKHFFSAKLLELLKIGVQLDGPFFATKPLTVVTSLRFPTIWAKHIENISQDVGSLRSVTNYARTDWWFTMVYP